MTSDADLLARVAAMHDAVDPVPDAASRAPVLPGYDWRALTLRQPWATWVALGAKPTENRNRRTARRGPLLIHAGLGFDEDAWARVSGPCKFPGLISVPAGAIIAVASIADCHEADGCCKPWGESGPGVFHWSLAEVRRLTEPVKCGGMLGFWRPDADTLTAVLEQIGAGR